MILRKDTHLRIALSLVLLLLPFFTGEVLYADENERIYIELTMAHQYKQTEEGMVLQYSLNLKNLADRPAQNLALGVSHTGGEARFYPELSVAGWRCDLTQMIGENCSWPIEEIPGKMALGLTFALLLDGTQPTSTRRTTHVVVKVPSDDGKILSEYLHVDLFVPFRGQSQAQCYLPLVVLDN